MIGSLFQPCHYERVETDEKHLCDPISFGRVKKHQKSDLSKGDDQTIATYFLVNNIDADKEIIFMKNSKCFMDKWIFDCNWKNHEGSYNELCFTLVFKLDASFIRLRDSK